MPRWAWQVSTERILHLARCRRPRCRFDLVLVDLLVGLDEHLAGERVDDVLEGHAAEDAVAQRLDDLAALDQRRRRRCRPACRSRPR